MAIEPVTIGQTTKNTFQTTVQNSRRMKKLFNGTLDAKITALQTLAEKIEATWWESARSEFATGGGASVVNALAIADAMCAGAEELMNQILVDLATVTGASHVAVSLTSTKSFYAPFVTDLCTSILAKTAALMDAIEATTNYDTYNEVVGDISDLYDWVKAEFGKFGPNFPTPYTEFHTYVASGVNATYLKPYVECDIDADAGTLTLRNYVGFTTPSAATQQKFSISGGALAAFHDLAAGDTVLLARLDVEDYEDIVGLQFTVDNVAGGDSGKDLILSYGDMYLEDYGWNKTLEATTFGENFELRKLVDA